MQPFDRLELETHRAREALLATPILADVLEGRFERATYVRFLTNAYHHVKHTVPLMMACGARLPERLRWLQHPLREYIDEEIGHERWILDDLAACGTNREHIVHSRPGHEVEVLVSYVYDYIQRHHPVGFFGMVYVLEGTSTQLATATAHIAQARLALPDSAFRYLLSHGELDQAHVSFFQNLVNRLRDEADLRSIIHVANRVFRLYADVLQSAKAGDARHAA